MSSISAIIITKNAENLIADCLDSLAFCSERIVVDNGSDDRTFEIAKRMGANVFQHKTSDFSKLRNFGLQKATSEWVLYVDSDERVTNELRESIESGIRNQESGIATYRVKRKNYYLGKHEWPYIEKLERLFLKDALKGWRGVLHESPIIVGEIGELDGFLLHFTHRDLTRMLSKTIEWSEIEARLRFDARHPRMSWWRFLRVMATAFFDSYIKQGGWKIGTVGLIESIYQAFSMFITYARLWEMSREAGSRSAGQQEKVKSQNAKGKTTT